MKNAIYIILLFVAGYAVLRYRKKATVLIVKDKQVLPKPKIVAEKVTEDVLEDDYDYPKFNKTSENKAFSIATEMSVNAPYVPAGVTPTVWEHYAQILAHRPEGYIPYRPNPNLR